MLSDVMEHFGLRRSLRQVGYFATEHHHQILKDLSVATREGGLIALTGVVGSGKTILLGRMIDQLRHDGQRPQAGRIARVRRAAGDLDDAEIGAVLRPGDGKRRDLPTKAEKSERPSCR